MLKYFTKGDIILVAALFFLSLASAAGIKTLYGGGKHVVVEVDGNHVLELSLNENVTKTVTGPLGETVIAIENGKVRVAESACPYHYCVRMGGISQRGEVIICVPNRVMVKIEGGGKESSFDGVTQ